jgi:hypothetical protein
VYWEGIVVYWEGIVVYWEGIVVYWEGIIVYWEGIIVYWEGIVVLNIEIFWKKKQADADSATPIELLQQRPSHRR